MTSTQSEISSFPGVNKTLPTGQGTSLIVPGGQKCPGLHGFFKAPEQKYPGGQIETLYDVIEKPSECGTLQSNPGLQGKH